MHSREACPSSGDAACNLLGEKNGEESTLPGDPTQSFHPQILSWTVSMDIIESAILIYNICVQ